MTCRTPRRCGVSPGRMAVARGERELQVVPRRMSAEANAATQNYQCAFSRRSSRWRRKAANRRRPSSSCRRLRATTQATSMSSARARGSRRCSRSHRWACCRRTSRTTAPSGSPFGVRSRAKRHAALLRAGLPRSMSRPGSSCASSSLLGLHSGHDRRAAELASRGRRRGLADGRRSWGLAECGDTCQARRDPPPGPAVTEEDTSATGRGATERGVAADRSGSHHVVRKLSGVARSQISSLDGKVPRI